MGTLFKILVIFWAAPTSLVGFLVLAMVCRGARIRWVDGALEVWGPAICGMFQRFSPIKAEAMVLGHFVFGTSSEMLAAVRRHERIHVRQVECWGPLFLPAYLIASAVVWMRGLNFYRDNPFEKQAYALGGAGDWHMVQTEKEKRGILAAPLVAGIAVLSIIVGLGIWWFCFLGNSVSPVYARHMNRGVTALEQFDYANGAEEYRAALKNRPGDIAARVNLGIALLNLATESALEEAVTVFTSVLSEQPNQPWACYSLAMILQYQNKLEDALTLFRKTTTLEPGDPHSWYQTGKCLLDLDRDPEVSKAALEKALNLEPALNAARYALAMHPLTPHDIRTTLLDEQQALIKATWEREYSLRYIEMGKFAEAMPWHSSSRFLPRPVTVLNPSGIVIDAAKNASIASLYIDGDEYLLVDGPTLKLLNSKDWSDITESKGLSRISGKLLAVADLNNDGASDLVIANETGISILAWLDGRFITVSGPATTGTVLFARTIDIDQDGDLDLVLVKGTPIGESALELWVNAGESPSGPVGRAPGGLSWRFERRTHAAFAIKTLIASVVPADIDGDGDLDIVVLPSNATQAIEWIRNDRLLRFDRLAGPEIISNNSGPITALPWIKGPESPCELLLNESGGKASVARYLPSSQKWETRDLPSLAGGFMHRCDINSDGVPDILILSADGSLQLLPIQSSLFDHLDGHQLIYLDHKGTFFASLCHSSLSDRWWAIDTLGALIGIEFTTNLGKRLIVQPTGRRDANANLRTNTNAIGALVGVLAGTAKGWDQVGTGSTGVQTANPIVLGTSGMETADAVRIRWPDAVPQAESDVPAGLRHIIVEKNRKGTSCPIIMAHGPDGFRFVTDCLGGGALGEQGPDGSVRPSRPVETVLLPPLVSLNGRFVIELSEPMDEILYLDSARLIVVDHPSGTEAIPDERMSFTGSPPTGRVMLIGDLRRPVRAVNKEGDCLELLNARDGRFSSAFFPRGWLGYAREHFLELEFPSDTTANQVLVLHGGVDYPYPESILAAEQAGVGLVAPTLEVKRSGTWTALGEIGFPAGLPKTMLAHLPTGAITGQPWRLRTNMQIHWDQIRLGKLLGEVESGIEKNSKVQVLNPDDAHLNVVGFYRETEAAPLVGYNPHEKDTVEAQRWKGSLTPPGTVKNLVSSVDDRVAICGPGRGIRLEFPDKLSELPPNWTRTFLLRVNGWCKDASVTTRTGGRVDPIPRRE